MRKRSPRFHMEVAGTVSSCAAPVDPDNLGIVMTPVQIQRVLQANVGKIVRVTGIDGESSSVSVVNVDDEGFVHKVVDHPDYDPSTPYWSAFDEILDVQVFGA